VWLRAEKSNDMSHDFKTKQSNVIHRNGKLGRPTAFFYKGPTLLLLTVSRAARVKTTRSVISNCLNCCVNGREYNKRKEGQQDCSNLA